MITRRRALQSPWPSREIPTGDLERKLMEVEYLLDSTLSHTRQKGCECIRPLALARVQRGLNALRGVLQALRIRQGFRHPTLFAGSAGTAKPGTRDQKQKAWGSHTPHRWAKDCDDDEEAP